MSSCVLPPIRTSSPPPSPVVTFFSVPRRYVKSNMQVSNDDLPPPSEGGNTGRTLRKSTRIQIPKSAPYTSPVQRTKEEEQPTLFSPQIARKRNPSLGTDDGAEETVESETPTGVRTPASAGSTGSGDYSPHVCLCQPEPKIPRPRNGESHFLFVYCFSDWAAQGGWWHCQIRNTLFVDKETSVFVRTPYARC